MAESIGSPFLFQMNNAPNANAMDLLLRETRAAGVAEGLRIHAAQIAVKDDAIVRLRAKVAEVQREFAGAVSQVAFLSQHLSDALSKISKLEKRAPPSTMPIPDNAPCFNKSDSPEDIINAIFQAGFRAAALRYHPDHGGDTESMQLLNKAKERFKRAF